jgi:hypothetical protein
MVSIAITNTADLRKRIFVFIGIAVTAFGRAAGTLLTRDANAESARLTGVVYCVLVLAEPIRRATLALDWRRARSRLPTICRGRELVACSPHFSAKCEKGLI